MKMKCTYQELEQKVETLESSNRTLVATMDSLDALVYVVDMDTYEVIFLNRYGLDHFGDITGKICWQALQKDQQGPCGFCTNKYLIDTDGHPRDAYSWEFQNTIDNQWYDIRDRAITWVDGRTVRLEIATNVTQRKIAEIEKEELLAELQKALDEVKTLKGIIPICSSCKNIRDDKGYWNRIETYIEEHTDAEFTHGVCQECAKKLYPGLVDSNGEFT